MELHFVFWLSMYCALHLDRSHYILLQMLVLFPIYFYYTTFIKAYMTKKFKHVSPVLVWSRAGSDGFACQSLSLFCFDRTDVLHCLEIKKVIILGCSLTTFKTNYHSHTSFTLCDCSDQYFFITHIIINYITSCPFLGQSGERFCGMEMQCDRTLLVPNFAYIHCMWLIYLYRNIMMIDIK